MWWQFYWRRNSTPAAFFASFIDLHACQFVWLCDLLTQLQRLQLLLFPGV
jgi:hypothetical protein